MANHPYGSLDGLMMGHLLNRMRGDFRMLANSVFGQAKELNMVLLPISYDETRQAVKLNLDTRATALNQGGSDFDAKRLADIGTATAVRGSDKRSPGGGTPDPIAGLRKAASLAHLKSDPTALMETLRRATYALSPTPLRSYDHGYEFEAKYKTR